ncbi:MAG: glycosyltransferase family 2 protein [Opitutaceae bacterium]|jgi:glycosyltransferase involved in cell wall biosynthesis
MAASTTHIVLLPTYNTGPRLCEVVAEALRHWQPVLVVVDGSTDGSELPVIELAKADPALTVLVLPRNSGKGAAVLVGARAAQARGFTHALVMDADGQHPSGCIAKLMDASLRHSRALVLGQPIFPSNMPSERRHGRKLSIALVHFELMGSGVADPLFGFRVYPLAPLLAVLGPRHGGRRYDFDTEAAVRLVWAGRQATPATRSIAPWKTCARYRSFAASAQISPWGTRASATSRSTFATLAISLRWRRPWRNACFKRTIWSPTSTPISVEQS